MVSRRKDIVGNSLSERESVMLDMHQGRYYGVKDAGHAIWLALENPTSIETMCAQLCRDFDVGADECSADVLLFLQDLLDQGLLDVHEHRTTG